MGNYLFVFDLDATITQQEILPMIASTIGKYKQMQRLTEEAMSAKVAFENSFQERVSLLQDIPVSEIRSMVRNTPLNSQIKNFIEQNKESCYIITSNLDVWISDLIEILGMQEHCFSSKGIVKYDKLISIGEIINKKTMATSLQKPFIAIGDGHNDAPMIAAADIGIGFGGVREIAPSVRKIADYNIESETELCVFLNKFV